jgi:hypothetical protein
MATLLSYALTTVADVKESLGLSNGDTSKDNLITRKINQATEMIERYTNRRFKQTAYTDEVYDATGTNQIVLRNRPISSVTLKSRNTTQNVSDYTTVDDDFYFIDSEAGILQLDFTSLGTWDSMAVTYTGGYSTIPSDIAEACATLAAFLVTNGTTGTNVKSKQEGQRKIEYFDAAAGSKNNLFEQLGIDEILDSYSNNPLFAA